MGSEMCIRDREIGGLGRIHLNVNENLKREWPRGVDRSVADRIAGR